MNNKSFLRSIICLSLGFLLLTIGIQIGSAADITACGTLSTAGTTYNLINDITNSASSPCFSITAANIVFNGNYYTVDGVDANSAFDVTGSTAIIKNTIFTDWGNTIVFSAGSSFGSAINLTITSSDSGIITSITDNITITNVTSYSNAAKGIWIYSTPYATIKDSRIYSNGNGIQLEGASPSNHTTIDNNTIYSNAYNILIPNSYLNTIKNNNIYAGSTYGIYMYAMTGNLIYNNKLNNTANFYSTSSSNTWNTTKTLGTSIIGTPYLGGNYWATPTGTGFSETCTESNYDGICDSAYTSGVMTDYLPLTLNTPTPINITSWGNNYTNDNSLSISVPYNKVVRYNITTNLNIDYIGYDDGTGTVLGSGISGNTAYVDIKYSTAGSTGFQILPYNDTTYDTKTWSVTVGNPMDILVQWNNYTDSNATSIIVAPGSTVKFNVTTNLIVDSIPDFWCGGGGNPTLGSGYSGTGAYIICRFDNIPAGGPYIVVRNTTSGDDAVGWGVALATNDNFSTLYNIYTLPYNKVDDTTGYTTETNDPYVCGAGGRSHSAWYKFTPTSNMTITSVTFGSNYDTVLSAHTGTWGAMTLIACNDDTYYNGSYLQSRIIFNATAGVPIYFMVGSYGSYGVGGNLVFTVTGVVTEDNIISWANDYTHTNTLDFTATIAPPPTGTSIVFNTTTNADMDEFTYDCSDGTYDFHTSGARSVSLICLYEYEGDYTANISVRIGAVWSSRLWSIETQYATPSSGFVYNRINHTLSYVAGNTPQLAYTFVYVNGTKVNEAYDSTTQYYNIYPEADTYINENAANTNYGTSIEFEVGGWWQLFGGYMDKFALLRFNDSVIPWDEYITNVNLITTYNQSSSTFNIDFHNVTTRTWTENGVTWNNRPAYASYPFATSTGTLSSLTDYAISQFDNGLKMDFLVKPNYQPYWDVHKYYASKENTNASRRPYINVTTVKGFQPTIPGKIYTVSLGSYLPLTTNGSNKDVSIRVDEINTYDEIVYSHYLNSTSVSSSSVYDRYGYNSVGTLRLDNNIDGLSTTDIDRFNRVCQAQTFNLRLGNVGDVFTIRDEDSGEILYNYVTDTPAEVLIDYNQQIGRPSFARYGINKVFIGAEGTNLSGSSGTYKNNETYRIIDSQYGDVFFDYINMTCIGDGKMFTPGAAFEKDIYNKQAEDVNITWQGTDGIATNLVSTMKLYAYSPNIEHNYTYMVKNYTLDGSLQSGYFKSFSTNDAQIQTLMNKYLIYSNGLTTPWSLVTNPVTSEDGSITYNSSSISMFDLRLTVEKAKVITNLFENPFAAIKDGFGYSKMALFLISIILMFTCVYLTGKHLDESSPDSIDSNHMIQSVVFIVLGFLFMLIGWIPFEVILVIGLLTGLYLINKIKSDRGSGGGKVF